MRSSPNSEAALDRLAAVTDEPEDLPFSVNELLEQRHDHGVGRTIEGNVTFEESIVSGLQKLVDRAGISAKIPFKVHPHMLRHDTGYVLANRGTDTRTLQSYLGHRSIQSTVRYTELAPNRFKNLWK
jgi:integrase